MTVVGFVNWIRRSYDVENGPCFFCYQISLSPHFALRRAIRRKGELGLDVALVETLFDVQSWYWTPQKHIAFEETSNN